MEKAFQFPFTSELFDCKPYDGLPLKTIIIASEPRVGSSLLTHGLIDAKAIGQASEFFNPLHMLDYSLRWGQLDHADYLSKLYRFRTTEKGVFCVKCHWHHFEPFAKYFDLGKTFFIRIQRKNVLRQTVSLFKAQENKAWSHIRVPAKELRNCDYDFEKLQKARNHVLNLKKSWSHFFDSNKIDTTDVFYDDLDGDYRSSVAKLASLILDRNVSPQEIPPSRLKIQRDEISEYYYTRFRKELESIP